jgi:hypothetical protein
MVSTRRCIDLCSERMWYLMTATDKTSQLVVSDANLDVNLLGENHAESLIVKHHTVQVKVR